MDVPDLSRKAAGIIPLRELTLQEVRTLATACFSSKVGDETKIEFLSAWEQRGETASELAAFAEAILEMRPPFELIGSVHDKPLMDCCGTGGGGLPLMNISTGMMFVLGAMGIPVVKHGNRAMTKTSGSADVLEALNIKIDLQPGQWTQCLEEVGVTFIFAQNYYPTFATIAPVRKALAARGQRTIFNLVGPLLNPARPASRLVGVFATDFLSMYALALELLCCDSYTVVFGQDSVSGRNLGEVSAHGLTGIRSNKIKHEDGSDFLVLQRSSQTSPLQSLEQLYVTNAQESAFRLEQILKGEDRGLGREMIILNAAMAAWTQGTVNSLEQGLKLGTEVLDSLAAWKVLQRWRQFQS